MISFLNKKRSSNYIELFAQPTTHYYIHIPPFTHYDKKTKNGGKIIQLKTSNIHLIKELKLDYGVNSTLVDKLFRYKNIIMKKYSNITE